MSLFADQVHEEFSGWALGFMPYGAADYGEVTAIAGQVQAGDDDSWFDAWHAFAQRRIDEGDAAAAGGRHATACDCYGRAAAMLGIAYHPIYGTPVDPRLTDAFHLQMATFAKMLANAPFPSQPVTVPYEGTTEPAYLLQAPAHPDEPRPTIIVGGGWDSTMVENHFGIGLAALARGYHVLLHDGPGQGRLLIDEGLPLRYDWEHVVTPVVDAALAFDVVRPDALAYEPWSLGGYMAPRVAAFEHRLAAVVADPGQLDVGGKFAAMAGMFGLDPPAVARLPELSPEDEAAMLKVITGDRGLNWKIVKRGFWTNGAPSLSGFLAEMDRWKLDAATVAQITTPMLVTAAESDLASSNAKDLYDALPGPKRFVQFTNADGAGDHCETYNRSFANRVILDWLDATLPA
jgi:alpha-beta hydrolase superfamily lysophospholipase